MTPDCSAECTMCGKRFEKEPLVVKDGDLCPECRKTYGGMAYVFCLTCKKITTRIVPGLSAQGILVKPGDVLHVRECPTCHPGIIRSVPIEFDSEEMLRRKLEVKDKERIGWYEYGPGASAGTQ